MPSYTADMRRIPREIVNEDMGWEVAGGRSFAEDIVAICARIQKAVSPAAIILFGSRARGTQGPDSDIDILVLKNYQSPTGWLDIGARALCSLTDLSEAWSIDFDVLVTRPLMDGSPDVGRGLVYAVAAREGLLLYEE